MKKKKMYLEIREAVKVGHTLLQRKKKTGIAPKPDENDLIIRQPFSEMWITIWQKLCLVPANYSVRYSNDILSLHLAIDRLSNHLA